jgi:hypothetical protein
MGFAKHHVRGKNLAHEPSFNSVGVCTSMPIKSNKEEGAGRGEKIRKFQAAQQDSRLRFFLLYSLLFLVSPRIARPITATALEEIGGKKKGRKDEERKLK